MKLLCNALAMIVICGFANSDLPVAFNNFNSFDKFRPSQNLGSTYEYTQYSPNDYILNLKSPNRFYGLPQNHPEIPDIHHPQRPPQTFYNAPPNGPFYQKPQVFYNVQDLRPPQFQKPLFTPAGVFRNYPATSGQIENYRKALEEDTKQEQDDMTNQEETPNTAFANGFTGYSNLGSGSIPPAKSYVNVKLGPQNLQYQYQF